jgi:hypothetical protein
MMGKGRISKKWQTRKTREEDWRDSREKIKKAG